jgi:HAD superfamily hydrolase (TIGR01509 family)
MEGLLMRDILSDIDMIVFDVFGTLLEISDRRKPFAHVKRKMDPEKASRFRRLAMTTAMTWTEIDAELQSGTTTADLALAQIQIIREVASTRIRPGVLEMLLALPVPYAICSNLSFEYVPALSAFPDIKPEFRILSCHAGCMKPDPEIYALVIRSAGVPAGRILFTGDTLAADIEGPLLAGMRAMHIDDLIAALTGRGAGPSRPDPFAKAFRAARGAVSRDLDIES